MADGGISETAIAASVAAAAAEAEAAAAASAITAAAATAATTAEAGAAAAGTAAAVAPELVAAAPEAFTAAAAAAPEVTAAAAPAVEAPFLGATATEAVAPAASGPLLGPTVAAPTATTATTPSTSLLSQGAVDIAGNPTTLAGPADPVFTVPQTGGVDVGTFDNASRGLLGDLGEWWQTASTGDKLAAGGKALSAVGTAGSAASAAKGPPAKGPTHTIQPGQVGKPSGGEAQLAAIVEAMLKRRDAYQQGVGGGAPVAYRPRGLLG